MMPLASAEDLIFTVTDALRVPVLVLAIAALAVVIVELGALTGELLRRRRRTDPLVLEQAIDGADAALRRGDPGAAVEALRPTVSGTAMAAALLRVVRFARAPNGENGVAKALADFDLGSLRRLERTRLLVRAGPALGLMGTLIPLAPALEGLAAGNVTELTENLRVAFGVTVLGLFVGAVAFGISLVRDRLYAQDLSDLEYIAAGLTQAPADATGVGSSPGVAGPTVPAAVVPTTVLGPEPPR